MAVGELKTIVMTMRIPFLLLSPVCVFLGAAAAYATTGDFDCFDFGLIVLAALAAHISVNTLNEYSDYRSGLDTITKRTPFSGGSGGLLMHPEVLDKVKLVAYLSLLMSVGIGFYFVFQVGAQLIPIGLVGVGVILSYTDVLNKRPYLCLVAPGLAFGPLFVVGTFVILTGHYSWVAWMISMVPFFLVNNLLLLNQIPDIEADSASGRKHIPIVYGIQFSVLFYVLFVSLTVFTLSLGVYWQYLPLRSLWSLLPLSLVVVIAPGVWNHGAQVERLIPYLGLNVVMTLLSPVILAVSLLYG